MKKYIFVLLLLVPTISVAAKGQFVVNSPTGQYQPENYQRDPFTTSGKMYSEVGLQPGERANTYGGFIPGYGANSQNAPKMQLKGYITKNVSKATALLEISGAGVYMVSEGDEIGLHALGLPGVLKIIEVSPNGVKVQAGRVNQVIIVR